MIIYSNNKRLEVTYPLKTRLLRAEVGAPMLGLACVMKYHVVCHVYFVDPAQYNIYDLLGVMHCWSTLQLGHYII